MTFFRVLFSVALLTLAVFGMLALWRLFRESRMGNGERIASLVVSLAGVGLLVAGVVLIRGV